MKSKLLIITSIIAILSPTFILKPNTTTGLGALLLGAGACVVIDQYPKFFVINRIDTTANKKLAHQEKKTFSKSILGMATIGTGLGLIINFDATKVYPRDIALSMDVATVTSAVLTGTLLANGPVKHISQYPLVNINFLLVSALAGFLTTSLCKRFFFK